jgi:tetratricopeptide (TPR) repeat protein
MSTLSVDLAVGGTHSGVISLPPPRPRLRLVVQAGAGASPDVFEDVAASRESEEARVAFAERAIGRHEYDEAVAMFGGAHPSATAFPDLALRALLADSWARMSLGQVVDALGLLDRARSLAERPAFGDIERAEVLYRIGCCRLNLSAIANAVSLFTLALELCERSDLASDRLRARILAWRSRCYQRRRDWEAAREDVERALELAGGIGDEDTIAYSHFQASLIAEREGQWLLARFYAEEAKVRYEQLGDRLNLHKLQNNLGGINFLLGEVELAVSCLQDAFRLALELNNNVAASYAMSSLAQVQLKSGEPGQAEVNARRALELLEGRVDHLDEIGNAQLVLGRALLEQRRSDLAGEIFAAAESTFERVGSVSHRAAAWIAQGDLATSREDKDTAAKLYRRAAEALQDFHF